jgi:DNA methylase.
MDDLFYFPIPIDNYVVDVFSADHFCPEEERQKIENKYSAFLNVTEQFNRQSVSYQLSKKDILHSWLKYKEGFSASLVNMLLDEMKVLPGDLVMDPFMGSGTTALVCQMRGINSIGYDIMPIADVSLKAKAACTKYDMKELEMLLNDVKALNMPDSYQKRTPYITITQDAYPDETERFLQFISDWRDDSSYSDIAKNLLTLCIINSLERISYTSKDGQYLGWDCRSKKVIKANEERMKSGKKLLPEKYVRQEILSAQETIVNELAHVISDIGIIQRTSAEYNEAHIDYVANSVLYEIPRLPDGILNGVITSPPYCNRYDYTRTYALELAYLGTDNDGIKAMRQNLLSCTVESKSKIDDLRAFYESIGQSARFEYIYTTINANKAFKEIMNALRARRDHGDLNNPGVVRMVEGYFTELAFIYAELYRLCKPGALVAFVNDNVRYGGEVIPVDFLSTSFAEQFGFNIHTIYALKQQKGNSSQQMAKYGRVALRKGITIWKK